MNTAIDKMSALSLAAAIRNGEIKVREACAYSIQKIREEDPKIHAFLTVSEEEAMKTAELVQARIDAGEVRSPLAGVPIAVKDNICTKDMRTTCASRILENFRPAYDADAVERLRAADLILIGKTNMDEFAMGSTTETSYFGATRNPAAPDHVPGGSSGGSCAAVAAGMVPLALGSDTGGSIRQPSAYCGVTGIKPTYGAVSRYGLIAYGSSLDQIGPVAGNVQDCAALLEILTGKDERDSTSVALSHTAFSASAQRGVEGMRIGLPEACFGEGLHPDIRESIYHAADLLRSAGAAVEPFKLDLVDYSIPAYYIIACAEASSNLERFDGVKYGYRSESYTDLQDMYCRTRSEGFGPEVRRRIMLGSFVLSSGYYDAYYLKALRVKARIREEFTRAFSEYDLILSPAAPDTAPLLGSSLKDPLKMYLSDIFTVSANLCGIPGISVPVGTDQRGLPIGMQILGDCFREEQIFSAAGTCERLLEAEGRAVG
ncbi:MAG: Asp-tRNA(Asn)/Glu-tRNA(Gln) amidotransferase subunit GatA [Eubacterium sp.]|nr:Asp-tRNA(Asn)/Glu-tRNA(Gln) amidotransferase subunit GatA [Eubacterium sp.]